MDKQLKIILPQVGTEVSSAKSVGESHSGTSTDGPMDSEGGKTAISTSKPATPVALQAGAQCTTTGSKNEEKRKRLSVVTTPPKEGTPTRSNVSVLDLTWDEMEMTSQKKRRIDSAAQEPQTRRLSVSLQCKLKEYIQRVDREVRDLYKLVGEVPNTKREIRDQAWQIRSTMGLIMTNQIQGLLDTSLENAVLEEKIPTSDSQCQTEEPVTTGKAPKVMVTIGTQTEETGAKGRRWEREVLSEDIGNTNTVADFQALKTKRWPEKVFDRVKVTVGNPLTTATENCTLILVDKKDQKMSKYIQKMYRERYPDLLDMTSSFEVMEDVTRRRNAEGVSVEKVKHVLKVTTDGTDPDLWEQLQKVREFTTSQKIGKLRTHKLLDVETEAQRKILQTVFHGGETEVELFVPDRQQQAGPQSRPAEKERPQKTYETKALEITRKGICYSDVLKEVKTSLSGSEVSKGIKTIRSTKTGSLLVVLDKDKKDVDALRKTLQEKIPQCQVRGYGQKTRERVRSLFIRNMDGTVTREEVQNALSEKLKDVTDAKVEVGEVRPSRNDTKTVTIKTTEETAKLLLNIKAIPIGISEGQVEERFDIIRCHRCWNYGHVARDCDETNDRRKNCYKCGLSGHKAEDCKDEVQCPLCDKKGHTAGGVGCKARKKAVNRARTHSTRTESRSKVKSVSKPPSTSTPKQASPVLPKKDKQGKVNATTCAEVNPSDATQGADDEVFFSSNSFYPIFGRKELADGSL